MLKKSRGTVWFKGSFAIFSLRHLARHRPFSDVLFMYFFRRTSFASSEPFSQQKPFRGDIEADIEHNPMSTYHTPRSLRNFQRLIERIDAEAMRDEAAFPESLVVTIPETFRFPVSEFEYESWSYLRAIAKESTTVMQQFVHCSAFLAETVRDASDDLLEKLSSPAFSSFRSEFDEEQLIRFLRGRNTPSLHSDHLLRLRYDNVHARAFMVHYWMSAHTLATHGETTCSAVFGFSRAVTEELRKTTAARVLGYCLSNPHDFRLAVPTRYLWDLIELHQGKRRFLNRSEEMLLRIRTTLHAGQPLPAKAKN